MDDTTQLRDTALGWAIEMYAGRHFAPGTSPSRQVVSAAERFYRFLSEPAVITRIRLVPGTIRKQDGQPVDRPVDEGTAMQLHDDEQVDYTVEATDAKGQPVTGEQVQFSVDNPDVLGLQVSQDGATATIVAGTEGSGVLTATVGALTATEAIDVIAGDATAISLVAGAVTKQAAGSTPSA